MVLENATESAVQDEENEVLTELVIEIATESAVEAEEIEVLTEHQCEESEMLPQWQDVTFVKNDERNEMDCLKAEMYVCFILHLKHIWFNKCCLFLESAFAKKMQALKKV